MAMKDSTKNLIKFLQEHNGEQLTAASVAEQLGVEAKSINGAFTMGVQKKGLGFRKDAEIEIDGGKHKAVKYLKLTNEGLAFDPFKEEEK